MLKKAVRYLELQIWHGEWFKSLSSSDPLILNAKAIDGALASPKRVPNSNAHNQNVPKTQIGLNSMADYATLHGWDVVRS
jgi:hypothetical protein